LLVDDLATLVQGDIGGVAFGAEAVGAHETVRFSDAVDGPGDGAGDLILTAFRVGLGGDGLAVVIDLFHGLRR
jgi:hypothetical protein